jgi:dTDP-glucose pyrophosphorylase
MSMDSTFIKKLIINGEEKIKEALKILSETGGKVLYIVNRENQLIGTLSDGDIRRGLLKNIGLEDNVEKVMNINPKVIFNDEENRFEKIRELMLNNKIESIPILNIDRVILNIILWQDIFKDNRSVVVSEKSNKVFILAGGFGTRLEPFTRILPKPLIPIGDKPILENIMDKFNDSGFNKFVISVFFKGEMIKLYLNDPEINKKYKSIEYIKEDKPLGTIGSLYLAKDMINETFFISNSDIIVEENLEKIFNYHKKGKYILSIVGCSKESVMPYGVLKTDEDGTLINIEEKPSYRHIINTGIYVAEPEIIDYIKPDTRMDMTTLIDCLLKDNKKIGVYPILSDKWFDIGQWAEYEKTIKYFEKK